MLGPLVRAGAAAVAGRFRWDPGVREEPGAGGGTKPRAEGSSQDLLLPHGAGADGLLG